MVFKTHFSPFSEKVICRCNLPCRDGGHFHCPFCGTTIIRKDTITMHLIECKNKCDMAQLTSQPPSPDSHSAPSSVNTEHAYVPPPSVSAIKIDHSYIRTASPKTPAVASDLKIDAVAPEEPEEPEELEELEEPEEPEELEEPEEPTEADPSVSPTATTSELPAASTENKRTGDVPLTHVNCPHCPLVLYKKNLVLHVKRKHGPVEDRSDQSHQKSTCVERSGSLDASGRSCRGSGLPVAEEEQHVTPCAQPRALPHSLCNHILPLECDTTAGEEQLDHQVLQEMVENPFFSQFNQVCAAQNLRICRNTLTSAPGPLILFRLDILASLPYCRRMWGRPTQLIITPSSFISVPPTDSAQSSVPAPSFLLSYRPFSHPAFFQELKMNPSRSSSSGKTFLFTSESVGEGHAGTFGQLWTCVDMFTRSR